MSAVKIFEEEEGETVNIELLFAGNEFINDAKSINLYKSKKEVTTSLEWKLIFKHKQDETMLIVHCGTRMSILYKSVICKIDLKLIDFDSQSCYYTKVIDKEFAAKPIGSVIFEEDISKVELETNSDKRYKVECIINITKSQDLNNEPFNMLDTKAYYNTLIMCQDLYVVPTNRTILATYSKYFYKLFFQNAHFKRFEDNVSTYRIDDVSSDEFKTLLRVLHPTNSSVTEQTCETLLKLSKRFEIPLVKDLCEEYLMKKFEFSPDKLNASLVLIDKYQMWNLLDSIISKTTFQQLTQARSIQCYENLSENTKLRILNSYVY